MRRQGYHCECWAVSGPRVSGRCSHVRFWNVLMMKKNQLRFLFQRLAFSIFIDGEPQDAVAKSVLQTSGLLRVTPVI